MQDEFKIESNIPLPKFHGTQGKRKYPFPEMNVGDSLLILCEEHELKKMQSSVNSGARRWAHKQNNGWQFSVRKGEGGFRIWRTK